MVSLRDFNQTDTAQACARVNKLAQEKFPLNPIESHWYFEWDSMGSTGIDPGKLIARTHDELHCITDTSAIIGSHYFTILLPRESFLKIVDPINSCSASHQVCFN